MSLYYAVLYILPELAVALMIASICQEAIAASNLAVLLCDEYCAVIIQYIQRLSL